MSNNKMGTLNKPNQFGSCNKVEDRLLDFLIGGHLHPEDYNLVVLTALTIFMIATTLVVIWSLKSYKNKNKSKIITESTKTFNYSIFNDQTEDLSITTIYDLNKPAPLNSKSTVIWDKLVREIHFAADKCYIKKYADRCVEMCYNYPQLINTKFGRTGLTPFHRVCFHGQAFLMKMMLKMGANPRLTTDAGENPICLASYYYLHKRTDEQVGNMICLNILHRVGCRFDANNVWYDLLVKMAVRGRKKGLTEWLFIHKNNRKSNQLHRSISSPLSS